jgi:hypothetical protein
VRGDCDIWERNQHAPTAIHGVSRAKALMTARLGANMLAKQSRSLFGWLGRPVPMGLSKYWGVAVDSEALESTRG